ncbi:hypothetical protein TYRP_005380 [Tyrophagus putrescentiae]|nr:hypothetical protein TYRP_005380 [Tyrophagus putrescentiae]
MKLSTNTHSLRSRMLLSPSSLFSQRRLTSAQCADVDNQPQAATPEQCELDHCNFSTIRFLLQSRNSAVVLFVSQLSCLLSSPSSSSSQRRLTSAQCADVDNQPQAATPEQCELDHCIFSTIRFLLQSRNSAVVLFHNPRSCLLSSPSSSSSQRRLTSAQCADVDNQPQAATPEQCELDHCIFSTIRFLLQSRNSAVILFHNPRSCLLSSPSSSSSQRRLTSAQCADMDNQPQAATPEQCELDHCIFSTIRFLLQSRNFAVVLFHNPRSCLLSSPSSSSSQRRLTSAQCADVDNQPQAATPEQCELDHCIFSTIRFLLQSRNSAVVLFVTQPKIMFAVIAFILILLTAADQRTVCRCGQLPLNLYFDSSTPFTLFTKLAFKSCLLSSPSSSSSQRRLTSAQCAEVDNQPQAATPEQCELDHCNFSTIRFLLQSRNSAVVLFHNPRTCMLLSPSSSSSQRRLTSAQCADVDNHDVERNNNNNNNFQPGSPAFFIIIDTSHLEYIDAEKRTSKSFDSF